MTPKEKSKKSSGAAAAESTGAAPAKKAYQTFARKWRPQTFSEVVGQKNAVNSLRNALEQGRIANAYLFCGPRGTGKTSMARILAKSLNCAQGITSEPCGICDSCRSITIGNNLDVIEIDGASYTRTEQIQEFLEGINRNPFAAKYKVYIIDEVHMLSAAAFNRLLKTLEEPPEFVVFILATTNAEKIPATIISRCQVQEFNAIDANDIRDRLAWIAEQEGIALDPATQNEIFETLAHHAEGGLRDASVALDQLINLCEGQLTLEAARQLLGLVDRDLLFMTMERLQGNDTAGLMDLVDQLARKGRNLERFAADLLGLVRDALLAKSRRDASLLKGHYTAERIQWFADNMAHWDYAFLLNLANQLLWAQEKMKTSANPRFLLEFAFIKLTSMQEALSVDRLAERLKKLAATPMPMAGVDAPGVATAGTLPQTEAAAPKPATPGGQTALFNQQPPALDFMNGLGLRGATSGASAGVFSDVLRDGGSAAAPAPMVREKPEPALAANINVHTVWAKVRQSLQEKAPFLNNHLDDARPLAIQGRRVDLGMINNIHTEYNLSYVTAPQKAAKLSETLAAVLGFEVAIRWQEISEQQAAEVTKQANSVAATEPVTTPKPDSATPLTSTAAPAPPVVSEKNVMYDSAPAERGEPAMSDPVPTDDDSSLAAEAAIYQDQPHDESMAEFEDEAAPGVRETGSPRNLNEAFARFPEFKSAVKRMQRLVDGEIVGFEPA